MGTKTQETLPIPLTKELTKQIKAFTILQSENH